MLDAEEYFHLALNASKNKDHHSALEYLHKTVELKEDHAGAYYLLGAEYAELGLTDRAIETMVKALELNPELELARFQLALLYMSMDKKDQTASCLDKLIKQSDDHLLVAYSEGLQYVNNDEPSNAIDKIDTTLSLEQPDGYLKDTMQTVLDKLNELSEKPTQPDQKAGENLKTEKEGFSPIFLDAYKRTTFKDDED